MATNKVIFGNSTLIDLTADTVTAADLAVGVTAHAASGAAITGTKKEPGYINLSANTVTLDAEHMEVIVRVTSASSYFVSESHSGTGVDRVEILGSVFPASASATIYADGTAGTAVVTITASATSTHTAATAYIFVTADFPVLQTVSWASGSDDQIAAMVTADRNGDIDLRDYWDVGDERTAVLSAITPTTTGIAESQLIQPLTFVILHKGGDNDDYRFIVGTKECLAAPGKLNNSTAGTSWADAARRTWCNNEFRNAIPSTFRGIFKQWSVPYNTKTGGSSSASDQYFALAAEKEVFGSNTYAQGESSLFQFDYYKTAANRIKISGVNGSACDYWTRSERYNNANFCTVSSAGASANIGQTQDRYISPIGRI